MSHPLYNPYESGNQSSSQGPYGLPSVQAERPPRRATPVLGPGSSFSSPATPANHGGNIPSLLTMPVNYRPEQSRARVNVGDIERSVDSHISRAREEVTSIGQSTRFTNTGTTSYPMSSTSASGGRRQPDVDSRSSSLAWLPCYKGSTAADSSNFFSPPASCSLTSSGGSTFNASSDRQRDGQSIPQLGDYDYRVPDKPAAPTDTSHPMYTSESASSILLNFGLEREDLEYLVQYPEDQLTPAKLPFILREIRIQKTNRAMTAAESKPYPEPQPFRGATGRDSLTSSGGSSAVLQPSKVIDYGHTSKYVGGVGDEIGRNSGRSANSGGSGSMLLANTNNSSHSQEPPQKEGSSVAKSSYNSIQSSLAPPRIDPAKQLKTQPNQTPQTIVSSSSLPRKDRDRTVYTPEACKPPPLKELETDRKLASMTQPSSTLFRGVHPDRPGLVLIGNSDTKNPSTTQGKGSVVAEQRQMQQRQQNQIKQMQQNQMHRMPQSQMPQSQMPHSQMPQSQMPQSQMPQSQMHRMPQSQMPQNQTPQSQMPQSQMPQSQMHRMPQSQMPQSQMLQSQMPQSQMHRMPQSQMPHSQMPQSQMHRMPQIQMPQSQMHRMPQIQMPQSQMHRMPPSQMPPSQMPPSQMPPSQTQQSQRQPQKQPERSTIIPRPINNPPPQPVLSSMNFLQSQAPSSSQGPAKKPVSKGLPAPAMMYDYAAASPRAFPHTCSLCFKECSQMKDWISHQNTSLHLESCRVLRTKYPEWNGDIVLKPRDAGKDGKPSSSASAQTYQHQKKSSHESPSHSRSPRRHFSSEGRGEKRSRSRSPRSSRYSHSSRSRSRSPRYDRHRSHSSSQERPGRRGERSPPKRSDMRRSPPRRTDERRSPPRRTEERRSPPRRTEERRSPPRRTDERRSPPRRTDERRSPPRRTDERRSPPRRTNVKRSPLRRSDARRSPQKRSRERRLSSERSPPQRKSSTERLAQKLLQKTDVQSLSKQTDLEAVVKTLLAEITKMKSSSSSSTSSIKGGKNVKSTPAAGRMGSSSAASSSSSSSAAKKKKTTTLTKASLKKSDASASTKTKSGRPTSSLPTKVRLGGVLKSVAHSDMVTAVEQFGEIESAVMHRHKLQAVVTFKKEEDAKKLKSLASINMRGFPVTVVKDEDTEPKKTPLKKPAVSSVSTSQTSKSTKPTTSRKVPSTSVKTSLTRPKKPLASASAAKGTTTGKCTSQKTAVKGSSSVTKAKVSVSKPGTVPSKPIAKTATSEKQKGKTVEVSKSKSLTVAEPTRVSELVPEVKVEVETASASQEPETPVDNLAAAGDPTKVKVEEKAADVTSESPISEKRTPLKSKELDSKVQQSVVVLEDSVKVVTGSETVPELKHEPEPVTVDAVAKEADGAEPMELGETGLDVAESMEEESCAEAKEEKLTNVEAVSDKSTESQPPTRKDETRPPAVPPPDTEADPKPADTSSQMLQTTIKTETADEASAQVPEPESAAPESAAPESAAPESAAPDAAAPESAAPDAAAPEAAAPESAAPEAAAPDAAAPEAAAPDAAAPESKSSESQPPTIKDETGPPAVPPPDTEADVKPADTSSQMLQTTIKTETADEASAQVQGPESTELSAASGLVIKMEASQPPSSTEEGEKTTREKEEPASAAKNQTDPKSAEEADKVSTEPTAGAVSNLQPAVTTSSTADPQPMIGEMVEKHFNPETISRLNQKTCLSKRQFVDLGRKLLMITNLPKYDDGCYTEEDVAKLLVPFGFKYEHDKIYVLPQICVAFAEMPTVDTAHHIISACSLKGITFKRNKLELYVVYTGITTEPMAFYKSVMKVMNSSVDDEGERIIYINNISPSEARDLREALRKIDSVTNYLPLLNKVFIEFESSIHADRLGVWYSLLKQAAGHTVCRLKTPHSKASAPSPELAANALPDGKDVAPGATIPSVEFDVPPRSFGPFWVTMATGPFVFPTVSPWFIIPEYVTVRRDMDIKKVNSRSTMFPTLMFTGLPEGGYRQEDVARLVWPYFPKQTLHSLYYNVIVLTLQRRAFVHFSNWRSCYDFIQDHILRQISFKRCVLKSHFVLEYMYPESKEELMYKSLMKWSNSRVPDPQSLEERLLCVEISETRVELVKAVMKIVASIAKFVSFLPLANRICVEMVDSSGVAQVVEKYRSSSVQCTFSNKVQRVESLKSRKQRLENSSEIFTNLELSAEVQPPTQSPPPERSDNDPQLVPQTSDSAKPAAPHELITGEDVAAEPSSTAAGDVAMEEDTEEVGPEIVLDSGVGPQANEDVEKVAETEEVSTTTTVDAPADGTSVPADSTTGVVASEGTSTDLPRINQDVFRAIKAAVRRHRLTQEMKTQSEENESSSNISVKDEVTHQEKGQDDLHTSDAFAVNEPNFNIRDFVTVDEVAEDVEEMSPDPHSSSSSSGTKETQSSDASSAPKQTSTRSLKDSKSSASSSSKSTKDHVKRSSSSISTSVSPKTTKDSSKPTKSSSFASSSFLSLETSPSSCHKAQRSKTKSPLKGSHTSSSSCGIRSSSTARERVKMLSAAVSVERLPVSQRQAAKESVVAKSDHKVSAEGIAAKTVESETKIEKSSEMHPPAQGQRFGLSQDQNVETGLKDTTLKDPEKGKEKKEEEEEEEDDDGEKYEILDSFDHRTNENIDDLDQVGSSDTKSPEPESLQEENFQVLDSVDNEDDDEEACSEKVVDTSMEDKRATVQEESYLVEDGRSTVKQLSREGIQVGNTSDDKSAVEDSTIKYQQANNEGSFQVLDTGIKQAARGKGDVKRTQNKEEEVPAVMTSAESCKPSKDVEEADDQIPKDEDRPPKVCDNKESDVTEQETFEILDSIDDQTIMDQNTEALSDQMSTDITRIEEEEDAYRVVDSFEDQPTTTESESDNKKPDATSRRDDRSSKRSGLRTRASKSEEKVKSPEKQDRMVKRSETPRDTTARLPKRDQDTEEEKVSEMVDSIEEELVQEAAATERTDRRRSGRGKKEDKMTLNLTEASEKADEDEEASYEILDSVEDETATEEPAVMTRSTRGRRGRTTKKDQTKKEDTPTRRRRTPARESQEKTPKMEKEASSKENSPTKKSDITVREEIDEDATYEILDSVEDEVLKDDRPPTGGKRKRGRPKKEVRTTRKDTVTLKGDKEADDEEKVSYQILDSVEDEMVEDHPPTEESHKNEEEEPLYQIVDSVEDDQVQEELTTEVSERGTKKTSKTKDETCPKEEEAAVKEDTPTCSTIVEASEKVVTKDLDHEGTSTTKVKDPTTPEVEKNQVRSALVNLDEVSDEEEDYPDDIAEEEELRERMAAAKEKQLTMKEERRTREKEERRTREKEERRTREKEERRTRERRSQSSSSSGGERRKRMGRGREKEEEVDTKELVTVDEVGADEAGEEVALQDGESDAETTAGELGGLVTLDEIVEEDEEEEGKGEQRLLEPRPPSKDEESLDSLNPKYLVTLDEAGEDEEEKVDEAEETSTSAKRKYDDDTEENVNFVTVDEVGEVEEEEEEEHKAPRTRGRAKKRTRKTPVRKSARGRKVDEREEQESGSCVPPPTSLEASSSLDKDPSALSTDGQQEIQKEEEEGANPPDIEAASAGEDLQPESLEAEEEKEGWSSADVKVVSKRKKEIVGPEAKRSRSQSPSVPADFELPPFRANQPLGQEFVVPKSGYFCNICRVFYLSESSAKDVHCSSQAHYNNLQAHYRKLQQNLSGSSTPNSQGFISD